MFLLVSMWGGGGLVDRLLGRIDLAWIRLLTSIILPTSIITTTTPQTDAAVAEAEAAKRKASDAAEREERVLRETAEKLEAEKQRRVRRSLFLVLVVCVCILACVGRGHGDE